MLQLTARIYITIHAYSSVHINSVRTSTLCSLPSRLLFPRAPSRGSPRAQKQTTAVIMPVSLQQDCSHPAHSHNSPLKNSMCAFKYLYSACIFFSFSAPCCWQLNVDFASILQQWLCPPYPAIISLNCPVFNLLFKVSCYKKNKKYYFCPNNQTITKMKLDELLTLTYFSSYSLLSLPCFVLPQCSD